MSSRVKKKLLDSTTEPTKIEPKAELTREPLPERAGPDLLIGPLALSIKQFCAAHGICVETYFRMQRAGTGPAVMKVGSRTMISVEAAAAWRREREAAARKQHGERTATEAEATTA